MFSQDAINRELRALARDETRERLSEEAWLLRAGHLDQEDVRVAQARLWQTARQWDVPVLIPGSCRRPPRPDAACEGTPDMHPGKGMTMCARTTLLARFGRSFARLSEARPMASLILVGVLALAGFSAMAVTGVTASHGLQLAPSPASWRPPCVDATDDLAGPGRTTPVFYCRPTSWR